MTNKYKAGDVVYVRLSAALARNLNNGYLNHLNIIAHHPAPEPVVRWVNVYGGGLLGDVKREQDYSYGRTCVLRLEWPDGDMSKPPASVTVEGV
jgi:hypothetical protein